MSSNVFKPVIVAETLLKTGNILCVENRFFLYKKGKYFHISSLEIDKQIRDIIGDGYKKRHGEEVRHCMSLETQEKPEMINYFKEMINLKNGMFNLVNMTLVEHDPNYNSTIQLPIEYKEENKCNLWLKTLNEIFLGVQWKIDILQEFFGYCLTADNKYQMALLNIGQGANGKSVIFKILETILGQDNISSIPISKLKDRHYLVELYGKLVNISLESESSEEISDANFKAIVSGDRITADEKYQKPLSFYPFCKLIYSMNTLPFINDKTEAFYRRIIILEYEKQFGIKEQNKDLYKDLLPEIHGIFNWMIDGLKRLNARGHFEIRPEIMAVIDEYKKDNNPILGFIEETLDVQEGSEITKRQVYNKYSGWCNEFGYKKASIKSLGKTIKNYFKKRILDERKTDVRIWKNLTWKIETPIENMDGKEWT